MDLENSVADRLEGKRTGRYLQFFLLPRDEKSREIFDLVSWPSRRSCDSRDRASPGFPESLDFGRILGFVRIVMCSALAHRPRWTDSSVARTERRSHIKLEAENDYHNERDDDVDLFTVLLTLTV